MKITEYYRKKGPTEMRETGRQAGVDMRLENIPIIISYIVYFLGKYFFRVVRKIQFAYATLCLMRNI